MAIALTDNRTIVSEADAVTGWTATQGPALITADPDPVEATGALGMVVSNATDDLYFGIGSTDLSDELIYVAVLAQGIMDTIANGGIAVLMFDGTDRIGYHLAGNDIAAFRHGAGPVNWQWVALDTTNLPSGFTVRAGVEANLTFTAITGIGAMYSTTVKAVGGVENCFTDIIRRGTGGITIAGGTSGDPGVFAEVAAADRGTGNQIAHGIIRDLGGGVFGAQGSLVFGDTGTAAHWFEDLNVLVNFEDRGFSAGRYVITIEGNSTGIGHFELGTKVGSGATATGVAGGIFLAPSAQGALFDATNIDMDTVLLYGCSFTNFTTAGGGFSADATNGPNHEVMGTRFVNHAQLIAGRVVMRDVTFNSYAGSEGGALLWNATINIINALFQSCTEGIEHPTAGTFSYDNLRFVSNTADINNSSNATNEIALSFAGVDGTILLNDTNNGAAQSFTVGGTLRELSSGAMELAAVGSPIGNATFKIYADSGGLPTGAALATSETLDVSTLGAAATISLSFNNAGQIALAASTVFHLAVEYSGGTSTDYITVGVDSGGGLAGSSSILNGSWAAGGAQDVPIEVRYDGIVTINATNGSDPSTSNMINTGTPPGCVVVNNAVNLNLTNVEMGSACEILDVSGSATDGDVLMLENAGVITSDGWSTAQDTAAPENGDVTITEVDGAGVFRYSNLEDADGEETTYYVNFDVDLSSATGGTALVLQFEYNTGAGWIEAGTKSFAIGVDHGAQQIAFVATLTVDADLRVNASVVPSGGTWIVTMNGEDNVIPGVQFYERATTVTVTESYNYGGDKAVRVRVREGVNSQKFEPYENLVTITSGGLNVGVVQVPDTIAQDSTSF